MVFFSSCDGYLAEDLGLKKGVKPSFKLRGGLAIDHESLQGNRASFWVEEGKLGVPLELRWISQGSSRVVMGISRNRASSLRGVRPTFELQGGSHDSSQVTAGELGVILS